MSTVRYDTLAVYVGPDNVVGNLASGDIRQLNRIQSTNYNIEVQREVVVGLGSSNANDNAKNTPFVSLGIEYLVTNGKNERALGLAVDGQHGALLNLNSGERDYFLLVNKPNETPATLGIGNGLLTHYGVKANVGGFVTASAEVRGFNIRLDEGTSGNPLPRVDVNGAKSPYTYVLPPIDTTIPSRGIGQIEDNIFVGPGQLSIRFPNNAAFGTILSGDQASYLQSFSFDVGVDRNELSKIGQRYPFKRCLSLPTELSLSAELLLSNFAADEIQNYFCQSGYDIEIALKSNNCTDLDIFWNEVPAQEKLKYTFKGMRFKSFASSDSIGERKKVSLQWSVPIGNLLDVKKNLFISGDFGAYSMLLNQTRAVSGEPTLTGQNLEPIVSEMLYKRTKSGVQTPDFNLSMTANFDINSSYPAYLTFFEGNSGIYPLSGKFGQDITAVNIPWNSDSYSTIIDTLPISGYTQTFSTIYPQYTLGYPGWYETQTGISNFYIEGEGVHIEPIELSLVGLPTWIDATIQYPSFQINPEKPFFFNSFGLTINNIETPTGIAFSFDLIAKNSKFKKIYKYNALTPYAFPISLPTSYASKTSIWLNPYNTKNLTLSSGNFISSIKNTSIRNIDFLATSGNPYLQPSGQNGRAYIGFSGGEYLSYTGQRLTQDFTNFTFFSVHKNNSSSDGASLIEFLNSNSAVYGAGAKASFYKNGNDLLFNYASASGVSGLSGALSSTLTVPNGFSTNWNLTTVICDGNIASGRYNGSSTGSTSLAIFTSGAFDTINIGSKAYHGNIGELILFPYKLNPTEMFNVENYLKYKWAI